MTQQEIDRVVRVTAITVFKYCMMNELDFSAYSPDSIDEAAKEMYESMWAEGALKTEDNLAD